MSFEHKVILEALSSVPDPRSGKDIVSTGMMKEAQFDKANINVTVELPSLNVPYKLELHVAIVKALQERYPQAEVNLHFLASVASPDNKPQGILPHVKNIIAVASGKGGVGKSTVSVNLALGLKALGAKVGLLDADVYGPSIPTMLGLVGQRPLIKDVLGQHKMIPLEAYGIQTMSIGFIVEPEQAIVLRGPRLGGIIRQFFMETIWDDLDYLIIDLPPGTGDVQLSLVQTVPVTGAVIVTTPQEVAIVDAIKAMNMFMIPNINVPILGVVENMSWFTPAELPDNKYYIFGEGGGAKLAKMANTVLLGQLPIVQSIREGGDKGAPIITQEGSPTRESFINIARNLARQTYLRNEMLTPSKPVIMES